MTFLDAIVSEGPNKGLTLRECMALGLVLTGNVEDDNRRADEARKTLTKASKKSCRRYRKADE